MNIKIVRYRKKTDSIDGHLYVEGMRICDCAENAKSAIKAGTYPVVIIKCKQHARKMPVIQFMNNSWAIHGNSCSNENPCDSCPELECVNNNTKMPIICHQIKPGNGVYHREDGSIIVGKYIAPGCLKFPKEAFSTIYDRLRKSSERGHEVTLTIEDHYPQPSPQELTPYLMGTQILKQF